MYSQTEIKNRNNRRAGANQFVQNRCDDHAVLGFVDNRKISASQKTMQCLINRQTVDSRPIQRRAKAYILSTSWSGPSYGPPRLPYALGFKIYYNAMFSKWNGNDPGDAEFKQEAYHRYRILRNDGKSRKSSTRDWQDDGYSRAADPGDYDDANGIFKSHDYPGIPLTMLDNGDRIIATWKLRQRIVDTDRGVDLVRMPEQTAKIKGRQPNLQIDTMPATPRPEYTEHNE